MIEIICNRDMGDEHRDTNIYTDDAPEPNTISYGICYSRDVAPYLYGNSGQYRYPCSSDQYTDTHVYAHGDAGDRAGE